MVGTYGKDGRWENFKINYRDTSCGGTHRAPIVLSSLKNFGLQWYMYADCFQNIQSMFYT